MSPPPLRTHLIPPCLCISLKICNRDSYLFLFREIMTMKDMFCVMFNSHWKMSSAFVPWNFRNLILMFLKPWFPWLFFLLPSSLLLWKPPLSLGPCHSPLLGSSTTGSESSSFCSKSPTTHFLTSDLFLACNLRSSLSNLALIKVSPSIAWLPH